MSDKRTGRAPALFDDAAFAEDVNRASDTGQEVALAARREYEQQGVPLDHLLPCEEEGLGSWCPLQEPSDDRLSVLGATG